MILEELLQAVRDGERSFRPASSGPEDMKVFQAIAKAFVFARDEGYLNRCTIHEERQSGDDLYDLVVVQGGLSHKGEEFLTNPHIDAERRLEEIVELRPNIGGFGINLRALWRRFRNAR